MLVIKTYDFNTQIGQNIWQQDAVMLTRITRNLYWWVKVNFTVILVISIFHEKVYISQVDLFATWFICVLYMIDFSISQGIEHSWSSLQVIINRTNQDGIKEKVFVNENIVVETCTIVETEDIDIEIEVECRLAFPSYGNASSDVKSATNSLNGREFVETIYRFYVEIVHWRRNLFKLSSGNAAKMFKQELTKWLEHFNCDSEYNFITLKVYMVLP